MSELALFLGEWPIRSALAGGVLLLGAALAMWFVRQPARRQRLGEAAVAGSLLAAVLCALPQWTPFSLSLPILPQGPSATPMLPSAIPDANCRIFDVAENSDIGPAPSAAVFIVPPDRLLTIPGVESADGEPARQENFAVSMAEAPETPTASETSASPGISWWPFLILGGSIYLAILGWNLLYCLAGYVGLWRWRRSSRKPPRRVVEMLAELTSGWRRPPILRLTRHVPLPISFGLFRPTILVPLQFARRAAAEQLRWIIIHELTHLRRRDAWSCLLLALGQAVYFFVPWFWWVRRQIRLCQEYVADAAAAAAASSAEYAQYLVSLSLFARRRTPEASLAASVLGNSSDLYRRIAMLLVAKQKVEGGCPRGWSLAAGAAVLTLAVGLSGIGLRVQAAEIATAGPAAAVTEKPAAENVETDATPRRVLLRLVEALPEEEGTRVRRWLVAASEPPAGVKTPLERNPGVVETWNAAHELRLKLADGKLVSPAPDVRVLRAQLLEDRATELEQLQKSLKKMQEQLKSLHDLKAEQRAVVQRALEMAQRELVEARQSAAAPLQYKQGIFYYAANENMIGRLGIIVEPASAALRHQLNLDAGRGLVVRQVIAESPAAKAGILPHDFLLEFAGKPVPDSVQDFSKLVQTVVKPNSEVGVVVIRKGEKKAIQGIKLADDAGDKRRWNTLMVLPKLVDPEEKSKADPGSTYHFELKKQSDGKLYYELKKALEKKGTIDIELVWPVKPAEPLTPAKTKPIEKGPEAGALTLTMLAGGGFKISCEEAGKVITIDGAIEKGKARVKSIAIVDGKKTGTYSDVDEVPGPHWQKVKDLIELAEKTAGHK